MRIERWGIIQSSSDPYLAPEVKYMKITGYVYGHHSREDGHEITTSKVLKFENGIAYTNSGSEYHLGEINPAYLKMFPNALDILDL